jgi:transcription elongation factor
VTDERRPTNPAIEAIRKHWAFRMAVQVVPVIIGSIGAYSTATSGVEARAAKLESKADVADDKASITWKRMAPWVAELERRIVELDAEVAGLKRAVRAGSKRPAAVVKPVNPAPAAPPPPLPPTVEKALEVEQQARPTTGAPPEVPKP